VLKQQIKNISLGPNTQQTLHF